jgi:predicted phosphodiesterase
MSKDDILRRFAGILKEHGPLLSTEYDKLDISDKPSRRTLFTYFGSWQNAVREAANCYNLILSKPEKKFVASETHPEVQKLRQQVEDLRKHLQTPKLHLRGTEFKFGVISDTHIGSLFCDYGLLETAYEVFVSRDVGIVLHAGDVLDGQKVYKGHDFEVETFGADGQVNVCVDRFPFHEGITTYFINGNHDRSFWKRSGIDIGPKISAKRADLKYLGYQEEDIVLGDEPHTVVVRLFHPEDGSAYAYSYKPQRYISELNPVNMPHILIMGHYHKAEFLLYQGVYVIQSGCMQRQTPFMRGRRYSAYLGFWIVKIKINENGVTRITPEFFSQS